MLVGEETLPVTKKIPEATTQFTIKHSRKAFEILSDKLYTDKHAAIVRELAQNAYDSHKDAGRPEVPIEIDLPTKMDPVFRVRDFGTGLEHDEILSIYTTYFESNKSHTNEFVGGLGLGSKSPFSYVDQFTVESWTQSGEKNTYCAFIGEDGTPTITRVTSEPYQIEVLPEDEGRPTGITITIAVKQEDFRLFRAAAGRMLKFYEVYPKILSDSNDTSLLSPVEYSIKGEHIGIQKGGAKQQYGLPKSYVLMGPVAYEIDHDQLSIGDKIKYGALFQMPCVFFSKVGKLDIHVSRERLSYDQATKTELSRIFKAAEEEIGALTKKYIADGATKFERLIRFNEAHCKTGTWVRKLKRSPSLIWKSDTASTMVVNRDRWRYKEPLNQAVWDPGGFTYYPNRWGSETPSLLFVDVKHHIKWIKNNLHGFAGQDWVLLKGTEEDRVAFEIRFNTVAVRLSTLDEPPVVERTSSGQSVDLNLYAYEPAASYDAIRGVSIPRALFNSVHFKDEYAAYIPVRGQYPNFDDDRPFTVHKARTLTDTLGKDFLFRNKDILGVPKSYTTVQKKSGLPLLDDLLQHKIQEWEGEQDLKAFSTVYMFKESRAEAVTFIRELFDQDWIENYMLAYPRSAITQLYEYSCYALKHKHYQYKKIDEMLSDKFVKAITGEGAKKAYAKKMGKLNRLLGAIYKKHPYLVAMNESGYRLSNQTSLRYWDTMKHYFKLAERQR